MHLLSLKMNLSLKHTGIISFFPNLFQEILRILLAGSEFLCRKIIFVLLHFWNHLLSRNTVLSNDLTLLTCYWVGSGERKQSCITGHRWRCNGLKPCQPILDFVTANSLHATLLFIPRHGNWPYYPRKSYRTAVWNLKLSRRGSEQIVPSHPDRHSSHVLEHELGLSQSQDSAYMLQLVTPIY